MHCLILVWGISQQLNYSGFDPLPYLLTFGVTQIAKNFSTLGGV